MNVGGHAIEPQEKMKYLGVIFDVGMKFIDHVNYINGKISKTIAKLANVFRNTFGYGNAARRIMVKGCIESVYLYASVVWGAALRYHSVINSIREAQRKVNSICARSYRDVGYAISTVLAGMPPLDLTIEKRTICYSVRKKYYPIMWSVLEPFDISTTITEKALRTMLDQRVLESWDRLYLNSIPESH